MFVETMDTNVEDLAIPSEEGIMDQKELDKLSDHWPHRQSQNNLTASEKLYIAMSMAHGLYDLHTYKGGQILHADVATEQWLVSKAGHVKLNDFNYAEIMTWNVLDGGYCPNQIKYSGFVRSPEELMGVPSDSSKDIYSFGHVIYVLLTGLLYVRKGCLSGSVSVYTRVIPVTTFDLTRLLTHFCLPRCPHDFVRPYYDEQYHGKDKYDLKSLIVKGKHPHVDKRYLDRSSGVGYIDFRLASIIIDCWRLDPRQRPSIGTILKFLQDTMVEANNHGYLEPSGRIQAPPLPHKATGTEMTSTNNRNTFGGVPTDGGSNTTST
jgi:serine/threonine protein kinase